MEEMVQCTLLVQRKKYVTVEKEIRKYNQKFARLMVWKRVFHDLGRAFERKEALKQGVQ